MIARIISPLSVAVLALVLAVAVTVETFESKANALADRILAVRRENAAKAAATDRARRAKGWDFWTIEMENVVNELTEQKAMLRQRSAELDRRSARLDAEGRELAQVRADIETLRQQIDQRVITIRADELKNLQKLAAMYSTLDPADAVAIFRQMDDRQAVKILSLMKPDVTGPIFDAMVKPQPDGTSLAKRAAALSNDLRLVGSGSPVVDSP
ncbi:MAG: MotE family protein [Opitutaceae bacterium]